MFSLECLLYHTQSKVCCWMGSISLIHFTIKGEHWKSQSDTVNSYPLTNQGKISSILESVKFYKIVFCDERVIETRKSYWMRHACRRRMLAFQSIAICINVIISRPLDHLCCSLFCAATQADRYPFPMSSKWTCHLSWKMQKLFFKRMLCNFLFFLQELRISTSCISCWAFLLCLLYSADTVEDEMEMATVRHRPEALELLEAQSKFTKKELQILYRGFKNVSTSFLNLLSIYKIGYCNLSSIRMTDSGAHGIQ